MYQKVIKFDDTVIKKYNFHQNKKPILIDDIDINKIVVPNKYFFGKQDFEYLVGYKDDKKLDLYVYFIQKLVHRE